MRPLPPTRGFTLLEVLVALAITSILAAGLAASVHVAFRAHRSATDGMATVRTARLTMAKLGRDIRSILPPNGLFAGAFIGTDDNNGRGGDSDSVSFYNTADPTRPADGGSDIQGVTIALVSEADLQLATPRVGGAAGASDDGVLVRRVTRCLQTPVAETPPDEVLCRHVLSFNLRYYDGTQWLDTWDSTTNDNSLPTAVEVSLTLAADDSVPGSSPYPVVRVFSLPCAVPLTPTEAP